mgnify:CR=1 FL=1
MFQDTGDGVLHAVHDSGLQGGVHLGVGYDGGGTAQGLEGVDIDGDIRAADAQTGEVLIGGDGGVLRTNLTEAGGTGSQAAGCRPDRSARR